MNLRGVVYVPPRSGPCQKHRLTVKGYHRMGETGILPEDESIKIPPYARHGIPEVWLIGVEQRRF